MSYTPPSELISASPRVYFHTQDFSCSHSQLNFFSFSCCLLSSPFFYCKHKSLASCAQALHIYYSVPLLSSCHLTFPPFFNRKRIPHSLCSRAITIYNSFSLFFTSYFELITRALGSVAFNINFQHPTLQHSSIQVHVFLSVSSTLSNFLRAVSFTHHSVFYPYKASTSSLIHKGIGPSTSHTHTGTCSAFASSPRNRQNQKQRPTRSNLSLRQGIFQEPTLSRP